MSSAEDLPEPGDSEELQLQLRNRFRDTFVECGQLGAIGTLWVVPEQNVPNPEATQTQRLRASKSGYMAIVSGGIFVQGKYESIIGIAAITPLEPAEPQRPPLTYQFYRKPPSRAAYTCECTVRPDRMLGLDEREIEMYAHADEAMKGGSFTPELAKEFTLLYHKINPGRLVVPMTQAFFADAPEMVRWQASAAWMVREGK